MNIITMVAAGAGVLAFGPGFLVQAAVGYVAGSIAGSYCESRMKKLHREICRHTGDKSSNIDDLGKMAAKASQVGGVICPVIPVVAAGVGVLCNARAERLINVESEAGARRLHNGASNVTASVPSVGGIGNKCGGAVARI